MSSADGEIDVPELDGLVHEPVRLRLLTYLSLLDRADFVFLHRHTGISKGNLSVQMRRLSDAGFVQVEKVFVDNRPRTTYALTREGRQALSDYKATMGGILASLPD